MLDERRIKEAESNVKKYILEGLLKKTKDTSTRQIFEKNSKESLKAAEILFKNEIYLWTIVSAYYSMFYIANTILIQTGYKTSDKIVHKVTADALISLIRPKLTNQLFEDYENIQDEALSIAKVKSDEMIESFDFERKKRNKIQYQTEDEDIKAKAKTSLKRAKEFIFEIEKLL